jgi:hypothetical protein
VEICGSEICWLWDHRSDGGIICFEIGGFFDFNGRWAVVMSFGFFQFGSS